MSPARKRPAPDAVEAQLDLFGVSTEAAPGADSPAVRAGPASAQGQAADPQSAAPTLAVIVPPMASNPSEGSSTVSFSAASDMPPDMDASWEPDTDFEPMFDADGESGEAPDAEPAWMRALIDEADDAVAAPARQEAAASTPIASMPSKSAHIEPTPNKSAPKQPPRPSAVPTTPITDTLARFAADRNDPVQPTGLQPLQRADDLLRQLDLWVGRGWLRALDRSFVGLLHDIAPDTGPLVLLAAALTSHQLGHGHVCLDLVATLDAPDFALSLPPEGDALRNTVLPSEVLTGLTPDTWREALQQSTLIAQGAAADDSARPLVLAGMRLYLRRYWNYELAVAASLRDRLAAPLPVPDDLPGRLAELFPDPPPEVDGEPVSDWQKVACALAARGRFSLITGGPGTGKTTTVVRLLAMLQMSAMANGKPLRIRLAAPTGKAAARLSESIGVQLGRLEIPDAVREHVPTTVGTLHRLLGSRPDSRRFRHDRRHPLSLDVLVVDEASMIDLEMMASVLDALPAAARLILLGDKDQLASVEAGAVLGDLCRDAEAGHYRADTQAWLEAMTGAPLRDPALLPGEQALAQQTVMLRHSRRFDEASGVGRLARAVNRQDVDGARAVLASSSTDLRTLRVDDEADAGLTALIVSGDTAGKARSVRASAKTSAAQTPAVDASSSASDAPQGYAHYLQRLRAGRPRAETPYDDAVWSTWAADVLAAFDDFRLLCALRKGPWGVAGLNQRVADTLHARGLIRATDGWYEGRPVLSTRNDYSLGLMNGDIGIAMMVPTVDGPLALRVAFPRNDGQGGVRFVLPSRIGAVETVFAMTVHKSQGSEFAHTALVLPPALNPVLTKELIYTGITRARHWFTLVESGAGVFDAAVGRQVRRLSGLSLHLEAD
jgi:exodeoxyribonuclease V alpha subunit